ncbi:MAG: cobyrinic acid a,c-diamide synthase [Alphaproteobacteria bacterium BRH_c36]|nr:MAG: cobyrinic acid a,c-diamide synthase [Alphaproteobacteria bacterium BRH_c36]
MIIGVLQQKGGVGKTTLALNIAAAYAKEGLKVLLVDADPQGSALTWSSVREAPPLFAVVGMPKPTLHKELPAVAADYDLVIIDGAPQVKELVRSAILASDYVLIPVQPSPFDVWSCADIVALVSEAQQFKPSIAAGFVINRKIGNTAIGRDVKKAFGQFPYPLLKTSISQRVSFAEAAAQGLTVIETAPSSPAAWEIYELTEILKTTTHERTAA